MFHDGECLADKGVGPTVDIRGAENRGIRELVPAISQSNRYCITRCPEVIGSGSERNGQIRVESVDVVSLKTNLKLDQNKRRNTLFAQWLRPF